MITEVQKESKRYVEFLKESQLKDGSWDFCYESGIMSDAYMIILLRTLQRNDPVLIRKLVNRLLDKQEKNGTWKLFYDEKDGNLSATVEAYYAILYSGLLNEKHPRMMRARDYIIMMGGLKNVGALTKVMLALTGQYPWPNYFKVPLEVILLPESFPINFYDFVGYSRVHLVPVMISANKKFSIKNIDTPDLSPLYIKSANETLNNNTSPDIFNYVRRISGKHKNLVLKKAEKFMLDRIEPDGTLYSYFSSTFLMIFALLSLGHLSDSPIIVKAIKGLKTFICNDKKVFHLQNSTSTIWNTTLINYALQASGLPVDDPTVIKANQFLLAKQQHKYGDWIIRNTKVAPGGWGFSRINTINPDIDDTSVALRSIYRIAQRNKKYRIAWDYGVNWLLSMQNNDGGWPAFEKNTDKKIITLIPVEEAKTASIDPSSSDLTGRTLEFIGNYLKMSNYSPIVNKAVNWLMRNQEFDGSWYGRWGISYIYGTWAAITGLRAVNIPSQQPNIQRGVNWLLQIQNEDGGWGESCRSDKEKKYIPLHASTPSQTAWAVDALIAAYDKPTEPINRGIKRLITLSKENDWKTSYPTGAGLPGIFYTNYHSYKYIFPLLALSHYKKKYYR